MVETHRDAFAQVRVRAAGWLSVGVLLTRNSLPLAQDAWRMNDSMISAFPFKAKRLQDANDPRRFADADLVISADMGCARQLERNTQAHAAWIAWSRKDDTKPPAYEPMIPPPERTVIACPLTQALASSRGGNRPPRAQHPSARTTPPCIRCCPPGLRTLSQFARC